MRAPAACWCARLIVESTLTSQVISLAAAARVCNAAGSALTHRRAASAGTRLGTRSPVFLISLVVDRSTGDLVYLIQDTPHPQRQLEAPLVSTSKQALGLLFNLG